MDSSLLKSFYTSEKSIYPSSIKHDPTFKSDGSSDYQTQIAKSLSHRTFYSYSYRQYCFASFLKCFCCKCCRDRVWVG
jgi:hypothetical protein